MAEKTSSIPGLKTFPERESGFNMAFDYLEARRKLDGAEGLWRIRNSLYDLEKFAKIHPGGEEWIRLTKGTDITEIFESHHLTEKASRLLPKYHIRDTSSPRSVPLTFEPNGFYNTFKKRALGALRDVDFHHPSKKSNMIADLVATTMMTFCIVAASTQYFTAVVLAGIFLAWTAIIGHNYFHMRDNFRMYYFDFCTMSSKDWRISHVLSHHTYPNTIWDFEMYVAEPFFNWLPDKSKSKIASLLRIPLSPIIWPVMLFEQIIKRYYGVFCIYRKFEFRDAVPFVIPLTMSFFAPTALIALKQWALIIMVCSFVFFMVGFNAAHHHPDIFHDGDVYRDNLDWGLLELDAVRDRKVIDDSDFLVLTNFGMHGLHHLLPTVDHSYLPLCQKAFDETCKEFGIHNDKLSQWELAKGQFKQLLRNQPKENCR